MCKAKKERGGLPVKKRIYAAVDLKSFYASVECVERGLDPLNTNLVVADESRTDKTICLAVSPSLKSHGVASRPRLFEVVSQVLRANSIRRWAAKDRSFVGASYDERLLRDNPSLAIDYIVAPPRMALYIEYSRRIFAVYLRYFAPEDIHVYSIDEVFIDVSAYTAMYKCSPRELMMTVVKAVLKETGITATVGIGTNLYLAKVAMDIVAKRIAADKNGVRIAELDVASYRRLLWTHTPITDFWRVGRGYEKRLSSHGMRTMGDIALMSDRNEDMLYKLFGVNAELLIDHAWGYESCTMADIKAYRPLSTSLNSGQVLSRPYANGEATVIVREMCEALALDLVCKGLLTNHLTLTVGYDRSGVRVAPDIEVAEDFYGRSVPRHAHGSATLESFTQAASAITDAVLSVFKREVSPTLPIRRVNICACNLKQAGEEACAKTQLSFFDAPQNGAVSDERERKILKAEASIKGRFGNNAIIRGVSLTEGATMIERNMQIGGHKA